MMLLNIGLVSVAKKWYGKTVFTFICAHIFLGGKSVSAYS
jgi:hypothetical protein